MTYNPADHTIDEVHDHLAKHPEDTEAVLAAEQARGDDARVTLVSALESQSQSPSSQSSTPAPGGRDVDPDAVEDIDAGYPDGEYPAEGTWGYAEGTADPKES